MSTLELRPFIPEQVVSGRKGNSYPLQVEQGDKTYILSYYCAVSNQTNRIVGKRKHTITIPSEIPWDEDTLEVLGLLQGEMSKTVRNNLTFANSDLSIMKKVIVWFERSNLVQANEWNWYIKYNHPPLNGAAYYALEDDSAPVWIWYCNLNPEMSYPKRLSFIKNAPQKKPNTLGTLLIEKQAKIFDQVINKLLQDVLQSMPSREPKEIAAYLRGIIAAEGCVNYDTHGHKRVFVTATKDEKRELFRTCFHRLGIPTKDCKPIKDIIISQRENILKLDELGLMTLHPEKHARFKEMIASYTETWHEQRGLNNDERVLTI